LWPKESLAVEWPRGRSGQARSSCEPRLRTSSPRCAAPHRRARAKQSLGQALKIFEWPEALLDAFEERGRELDRAWALLAELADQGHTNRDVAASSGSPPAPSWGRAWPSP
jgi:hypothetical protein